MATTHTQLFVAFEGGDGAGKSTQVRLLAEALRRLRLDVLQTRQPGGTELGARLRDLVLHGDHVSPRAEALLYAADKAHHVDTVVRPALARGEVVVTDRYVDSAIAYQGAGRDLGDVHDRLEAEGDEFHEAVRAHFVALAKADPDRYLLVDATLPADEIHAQVLDHLGSRSLVPEGGP